MSASTLAVAAQVQAAVAALQASAADPADAVRLLAQLAVFQAPTVVSAQAGVADVAGAIGDLFRRTAVIALARASAIYQPASYDDAAALRELVTGLLDDEITLAGDQGEDASYAALRALRVAVVKDLTARGASLAPIVAFELSSPLPALAAATRLYRDPSRADQLVTQVDPVHPLFLPPDFAALAS